MKHLDGFEVTWVCGR